MIRIFGSKWAMALTPILLLAAILGAGCGGGSSDAAGGEEGSSEAPPPLRIERVASVAGEAAGFGRVESIVVDAQGRMYLADTQTREIPVFGPDGERIGSLGGSGGGPGEFTYLGAPLGLVDGALLAMDWQGRRGVTLFTLDGTVAATDPWPPTERNMPTTILTGADGALGIVRVQSIRSLSADEDPPPQSSPELVYREFQADGSSRPLDAIRDTLVPWVEPAWCKSNDGQNLRSFRYPFTGRGPLRALLPGGELAMADPASYTIDVVDPTTGSVTRTIRRDVEPLPLREDWWEEQAEVQDFIAFVRRHGGPALSLGGSPCPYYTVRPDHLPVLRTLIADEAGRLWVESTGPDGVGFLLGLIDSDGRLLGEGPMPDRDERVTPFARGDRLYVVTRDSLDVQGVQVYRVTPGS